MHPLCGCPRRASQVSSLLINSVAYPSEVFCLFLSWPTTLGVRLRYQPGNVWFYGPISFRHFPQIGTAVSSRPWFLERCNARPIHFASIGPACRRRHFRLRQLSPAHTPTSFTGASFPRGAAKPREMKSGCSTNRLGFLCSVAIHNTFSEELGLYQSDNILPNVPFES